MNKKILSLAVAAAIAAPMAAQADVSISGALSMDMYNDDTPAINGLTGSDAGTSKLDFNVKSGKAFAKYALALNKTIADGSSPGTREAYAGVEVGGMDLAIARQANAYNGGVKVDTMTANFLEARNRPGGVSKVASFVDGLIGLSGKAGDVSWAVQYGPAYATSTTFTNPVYANVKFKAAGATIGVGYQNDPLGNATTGLSAKMKFGDIAVGASLENADSAYTNGNTTPGTTETIAFADVAMPVGSGTIGLGVGSNTTTSQTFTRISYQMKVDAATVTIGGSNADGNVRAGAGLKVSF